VTTIRPLLMLLAAAAAGLAIGLAVVALGDDDRPPIDRSADERALRLRTSISPRVHLFGEPVTAEAEFVVDPARIDPSGLQLEARFFPYTQVAAERTETAAGDLVRIRYRFRLSCTRTACLPSGDKREIQLETARVAYGRRDTAESPDGVSVGTVRAQDIVGWPTFEVTSRLGPFDVERAHWRAELGELPPPSVRATPTALGAALLGSSALLALLGTALVASQLLRRPDGTAAADDEQRPQTPLERALAGVLASSANGAGPEQRKSLERLARELSAGGRSELAARARRLAWSPRQAGRAEVESFAADVRAVIEEER
jgi:hypothetical protein